MLYKIKAISERDSYHDLSAQLCGSLISSSEHSEVTEIEAGVFQFQGVFTFVSSVPCTCIKGG